MAGAVIIASAIGILLLILVGYVLVGGTLASGDIITSAQKDQAIAKEAQMNTMITLRDDSSDDRRVHYDSPYKVEFVVLNEGNEMISDFSRMDIIVSSDAQPAPVQYRFGDGTTANTWNITYNTIHIGHSGDTERLHMGILDPGEEIHINLLLAARANSWVTVTVAAPNGATLSETITNIYNW
jgi:hypothetical protein